MTRFNLRRLRTDLRLKQSDVAQTLEIPQSSVSAMENGKTTVSPAYIDKLQQVFNIDNIEDYNDELDIVRIHNNRGNNNGYNNHYNNQMGLDAETVAKMATLDQNVSHLLSDFNERIIRLENKRDELEQENKELHRQLTAFQVLCAKNGIEFEQILAKWGQDVKITWKKIYKQPLGPLSFSQLGVVTQMPGKRVSAKSASRVRIPLAPQEFLNKDANPAFQAGLIIK